MEVNVVVYEFEVVWWSCKVYSVASDLFYHLCDLVSHSLQFPSLLFSFSLFLSISSIH